jgi:hypothetical protein
MYGKEKGLRSANRWWDIRNSLEIDMVTEKYKIVHGLA